jgi:hypothetical protein
MSSTEQQQDVQAITGIKAVDQFLEDLPTKIWDPDEPNLFSKPRAIGFTANGMDVLVPEIVGVPDAEDAHDAAANFFIAYAKTKQPIAMAMVSEGFQWSEGVGDERKYVDPADPRRRTRVDCDRYAIDAEYRAQIKAGGRQEVLMVMLETAERQWMITWPIHRGRREGRWLGSRQISGGDDSLRSGRFSNLLRKHHAADEIVNTAKPPAADRPFNPRPAAELAPRLPAALEPLRWDPCSMKFPPEERQRHYDQHTFDVAPDLRLDFFTYDGRTSVLAINFGPPLPLSEFRAKVLRVSSELRGIPCEEIEIYQTAKAIAPYGAAGFLFRDAWEVKPCNA